MVEAALGAGASIVNDVSGLLYPEVAGICADQGAALVVMHNRSKPKERLTDPHRYDDVTADVVAMLTEMLATATSQGLSAEQLIVDPGIDFAKTPAQSITVLREVAVIEALGRPVLFALSRKDFIGALTRQPPRQRGAGTLATIAHLGARPGHLYRVHDLGEAAAFLTVLDALSGRTAVARRPHAARGAATGATSGDLSDPGALSRRRAAAAPRPPRASPPTSRRSAGARRAATRCAPARGWCAAGTRTAPPGPSAPAPRWSGVG